MIRTQIETENASKIDNPSREDIAAVLRGLDDHSNRYATLSVKDGFMQASVHDAGHFSLNAHLGKGAPMASDQPLDYERTLEAMTHFLTSNPSWRTMARWHNPLAEGIRLGRLSNAIIYIAVIVAALLILVGLIY